MSKIIIEYLPNISLEVQKLIKVHISYSMISNDESSCHYEISECLELLEFYNDVYKKEIKYLLKLISKKVSFLEF